MKMKNQSKCWKFLCIYTAVPEPVELLDVPPKIDRCDLLLEWKETGNNGASIETYTVYQRTAYDNKARTQWKNIHSSLAYKCTVFNLERGKRYEFRVTATNKHGEGAEGNIKEVKVQEGKFLSYRKTFLENMTYEFYQIFVFCCRGKARLLWMQRLNSVTWYWFLCM